MNTHNAFLFPALLFCANVLSAQQAGVYPVTAYGAKGDGQLLNTAAFQQAVDACNKAGGGEVVMPPGTFVIGTVHLKLNVHLLLKSGATIKGSANLNDYEIHVPPKPYDAVHKGMFFTEDAGNVVISDASFYRRACKINTKKGPVAFPRPDDTRLRKKSKSGFAFSGFYLFVQKFVLYSTAL